MKLLRPTYYRLTTLLLLVLCTLSAWAQEEEQADASVPMAQLRREGILRIASADSVADDTAEVQFFLTADSLHQSIMSPQPGRFIPNPKKALWLAVVFPGGGQIYNRKYWKLPLVYGGFLGCAYAMTWNNTMYRDYSQAYIDIMDSDDNTKSYENFLPAKYDVNSNITRLQELFRRKKNYYRRYRDLSMFCMMGVYALSILDAYVDAELSSFDISRDLSLKVHPAVINERNSALQATGMNTCSYGLQCSIHF